MPQSEFWPFTKNKPEDVQRNGETLLLQKQLGDMEGEVKEIQMELAAIKRDRLDKLAHKKIKPFSMENIDTSELQTMHGRDENDRFPEIYKLREELMRAKNAAEEERFQREKYEGKLKNLELKLDKICFAGISSESKETRKVTEGEVTSLKSQLRDLREETDEMNMTIVEKNEQLQDYRNKYLQAQQQVEELKRQLDTMEYENKQVSDQIHIEIQKMKIQFQEKLQELAPLPDLLKGAQIQMQEAKQLQRLAEDSTQQLSNELYRVKEKLVVAVNNLNQSEVDRSKLSDENKILKLVVTERDKDIENINKTVAEYKFEILRLQEKMSQLETQYMEKGEECTQLLKDLEDLRQESKRCLNRNKERSESLRRYLQSQVSELEKQLVQTRAQCKTYQKERDEVRQHMQNRVDNLQENFELVGFQLRNLQNQIRSLKNCYPVLLVEDDIGNEINNVTTNP